MLFPIIRASLKVLDMSFQSAYVVSTPLSID
jgi:hypothetical protein